MIFQYSATEVVKVKSACRLHRVLTWSWMISSVFTQQKEFMEGSSSSQHKLTLAKQTWISRCSLLFFQPNVTYEADKLRPICHSHPVLTWMFTRGQKFAKALLVFIGAGLGGLWDVANLSSSAESCLISLSFNLGSINGNWS